MDTVVLPGPIHPTHLRRSVGPSMAVFTLTLLTALASGCFRSLEGTWRLETEGWVGELVVGEGVETWVFHLHGDGPKGALTWEGTTFRGDGGVHLDVFNVNGEIVYPDRDFSMLLKGEGDTLTGEILGTLLTFRKL